MAAASSLETPSVEMTHEEWLAEGTRLFGEDSRDWAFVCPCCGHRATVGDYRDAHAPEAMVAVSCIGRIIGAERQAFGADGAGPCNYAGVGLFKINPVTVVLPNGKKRSIFAFAGRLA